jgi:hypothetical protein
MNSLEGNLSVLKTFSIFKNYISSIAYLRFIEIEKVFLAACWDKPFNKNSI